MVFFFFLIFIQISFPFVFSTVSTSPHTYGIDVIDLRTGVLTKTIPMTGNKHVLWSLNVAVEGHGTNSSSNGTLLFGPTEDGFGNLDWRTLNSDTEEWQSVPLNYEGNVTWNNLWGNLGSMRAYDEANDVLYVLVSLGRSEQLHFATIDVKKKMMRKNPVMLNGDVGFSSEVLLQMVLMMVEE